MAAQFESVDVYSYMVSGTTVISQCVPPSQTQCHLVYGRVEESQGQVTPDTPWSSGLAFPRPPVFGGHQILQSDAHWRRPKGDLSCLDVGVWRDGSGQEGAHWGVRHKTLKRTRFWNHMISLPISDNSSKSMQILSKLISAVIILAISAGDTRDFPCVRPLGVHSPPLSMCTRCLPIYAGNLQKHFSWSDNMQIFELLSHIKYLIQTFVE